MASFAFLLFAANVRRPSESQLQLLHVAYGDDWHDGILFQATRRIRKRFES